MVKITEASKHYMPYSISESPYDGAKPMLPVDIIDNSELLKQMIEAMYDELPEPRQKKKKIKK